MGNRGFALELVDAKPQTGAAFLLSTATQPVPFGGCTFFTQGLAATAELATGAGGGARFALSIPDDPTLRGVVFVAQRMVLAQPGAPLGLEASAGVQLVFGD